LKKNKQISLLPSYARYKENAFPKWKRDYILKIRKFFKKYQKEFKPLFKNLKNIHRVGKNLNGIVAIQNAIFSSI